MAKKLISIDDSAAAGSRLPALFTTELGVTFPKKVGGNDFRGRSTFHQPPSGGPAGIASYRVDNNGDWIAGQVVVKSATENPGRSVFDWSNVDPGAGYLFHLVAGQGMGGGLIGIGADGDTGTDLVVSAKGAMTGMGLTNTSTSSGVGFAGGNFGTGKLINLEKGNAAAGALLTLRGFAGGTNGLLRWRNSADSADMGWIDDGGAFNLAGLAGHHTKWDHGSAFDQRMYAFSGTDGQFWTTDLQGSAQSLLFRAGQSGAHAKGAEALTTILEIKGGARMATLEPLPSRNVLVSVRSLIRPVASQPPPSRPQPQAMTKPPRTHSAPRLRQN